MNNEMKKKTYGILKNQLENMFEKLDELDINILEENLEKAFENLESILNKVALNNYDTFSPFHSGKYGYLLYFLANLIYKKIGNNTLSDKLYLLNKIINSLDLYYAVEMPQIFFWEHPVGTVLGRAKYSNNFVIYQNCTVGGNFNANGEIHYPEISENVTMYSYSVILGNSFIGKNCIISSGTYIKDEIIPENKIVFGRSPNLILKDNFKKKSFFKEEIL